MKTSTMLNIIFAREKLTRKGRATLAEDVAIHCATTTEKLCGCTFLYVSTRTRHMGLALLTISAMCLLTPAVVHSLVWLRDLPDIAARYLVASSTQLSVDMSSRYPPCSSPNRYCGQLAILLRSLRTTFEPDSTADRMRTAPVTASRSPLHAPRHPALRN